MPTFCGEVFTMARILSVSVCSTKVPLDIPTSFATRTVRAREYCLIKLRSTDGVEGIGFCYVGSSAGALARVAVTELLGPLLIGEESTRVEGLWENMYREGLLQGRAGSVMRALSALDIAIWDMNARSVAMPLYKYLGYWAKDRVPAYASGGYYLEGKTPQKLGKEVASYVSQGFKAVKIKVGRLSLAQEEDRIRAAREAIGSQVHLMLDANNAWTDLPTALLYCKTYEKYYPYWIEEPFSPDDIDNHAKLAQRTSIPVATGEIETGRWRFKELLDKQAAMILQTDAAVCGGISEWRRIANTAASYGVTISPHWFHDLHVHLVASVPNARYVEYFPDEQVLNFRKLIDRQMETEDGDLLLSQAPGLGFQFDDVAVEKYSRDSSPVWTVVK
jgi:L-alanine-DL-glutamate epimerase-like enolase superfamily enzyme